jgi:hypothetical protein
MSPGAPSIARLGPVLPSELVRWMAGPGCDVHGGTVVVRP